MGTKVLPLFIASATYGAVCAMVFSGSRVIFAAAKADFLPFSGFFSKISSFNTPVNALLLNWVLTVILMIAPPPGAAFSFLVDLVGYPTWIFYGLAVLGLLILRKTQPDRDRPFKVFVIVPFFVILMSIFLSVFPFYPTETDDFPYYLPPLLGLCFVFAGIPLWYYKVRGREPNAIQMSRH